MKQEKWCTNANNLPASVCLFCGSRHGNSPKFRRFAKDLGEAIAAEGWRLIYGAGNVGLMGEVATAARNAGGVTFGVIPRHLIDLEVANFDVDCFVQTENMHERKKIMFMNSDAFVVLPGGIGSLDEFFEVLTWRQLGLHEKPIFLMNVDRFWDGIVGVLEGIIDEGFADATLRDQFFVIDSIDRLVRELRAALPFEIRSIE